MEDPVIEGLPVVQVDCPAANLPPHERDILGTAVVDIDLLFQFLVVADAHIRLVWAHEGYGIGATFLHRIGNSVEYRLRSQIWNRAQVQKPDFHQLSSPALR